MDRQAIDYWLQFGESFPVPAEPRTPLPNNCTDSCFVTLGEADEAIEVEVAYLNDEDIGVQAWYVRLEGKWIGVYSGIFSEGATKAMEAACAADAKEPEHA